MRERPNNTMRDLIFNVGYSPYADGSCLIKMGNTHVLCNASIEERVPSFLRYTKTGWINAEYSMLPRATHDRTERESRKGKIGGRTHEIQRLIGRSLRTCIDLSLLGERQIIIDCDVLNADGGTRTASINGGFVSLHLAMQKLVKTGTLRQNPIKMFIGAISCGVNEKGDVILDLDYKEDSSCQADGNFVFDENQNIIEIQCTSEKKNFAQSQFDTMLDYARSSISDIIARQKELLL